MVSGKFTLYIFLLIDSIIGQQEYVITFCVQNGENQMHIV